MKTTYSKRILSAVLAFILLISCVPVFSIARSNFAITYESQTISTLELPMHEKLQVSAENLPDGCSYQWQIQIPGSDMWVDIQGKTAQTLDVSYAVVGSLTDSSNCAYVRCSAVSGGEMQDSTRRLCVMVMEEEVPETTAPIEESPATTEAVVATEPVVVPEATEAPVVTEPVVVPEATEAPVVTEPVVVPEATEAPVVTEPVVVPEATEAPVVTEPVVIPEATEAPVVTEPVVVPEATEVPMVTEPVVIPEAAETPVVTEPVVIPEATETPVVTEPVVVPEATEAPVVTEPVVAPEATEAPVVTEPVVAPEATEPAPVVEGTVEFAAPAPMLSAPAVDDGIETVADETTAATDPTIDENTKIVSVTIEYHYVDRHGVQGDMVMDPYIARVPENDPLKVTVPCRVFPGYEIKLDQTIAGVTLNGKDVVIDIDSVTQDETIIIHYSETMVPYYARFFMQNVYNDLYTERTDILTQTEQDNMKGYAGDEPDTKLIYPNNDKVKGFSALFHQPDLIAADGSTVFEVYYDRNYYLINFDMDGGYGTAPVYARYGTTFTVSSPTRPGYTFAGWTLMEGTVPDGAEKDSNGLVKQIPASNLTYKANWTQGDTFYSIAYWILDDNNTEDLSDDKTSFLGTRIINSLSGVLTDAKHDLTATLPICGNPEHDTTGHTTECFVTDLDLYYMEEVKDGPYTIQNVPVEGDGSTIVNVYYEYKEYTLKFYYAFSKTSNNATTYHIVGGTSHPFGWDANLTEIEALKRFTNGDYKGQTGEVDELPKLTPTGITRYTSGSEETATFDPVSYELDGKTYNYNAYYDSYEESGVTYKMYYLCFNARYKDNISNLWPCNIFQTVTRTTANTHGFWSGMEAMASGWNGEHHVWYTRNNGNPTIKGVYEMLDHGVLFDNPHDETPNIAYEDSETVAYICFWENGANIDWSVPEMYVYNIWLPCVNGNTANAPTDPITGEQKETKAYNGVNYYLEQSYYTCDDSNLDSQTKPALTGYKYRETEWGAYFLSSTTKNGYIYLGQGREDTKAYYNADEKRVYDSNRWNVPQELTVSQQTDGTYLVYDPDLYDPTSPSADLNHTIYREAYFRDFYYSTNRHTFNFYNHCDNLFDGSGVKDGVEYGASLKLYGDYVGSLNYEEDYYPATLEPGAYYFDGWYYSPNFLEGTEVHWNTDTMPDHDVTVYAKWTPYTYDTYFYLDYDRYLLRDPKNPDDPSLHLLIEDTPHGSAMVGAPDVPTHDINPDYQFVGWFYRDTNGNKVAFNPAEMAVRQELHLYAEWSTKTVRSYTVSYAMGTWDDTTNTVIPIKEGEPGYRELSKDTTGYAFEASTRTFAAKSEDALEGLTTEEIQDKIWAPHTNSHSILMKSNNDDNVFTFYYVARDNIPYTVRYLDAATKEPVIFNEDKTEYKKEVTTNKNAVVTEQFVYVPGYIADAFHKKLVLSANPNENVIYFYYTKDENYVPDTNDPGTEPDSQSSRYLVSHYIQDIGADTYSVAYIIDDLVGVVGEEVSVEPLTISGFTFSHSTPNPKTEDGKTVVFGVVTSGENEGDALQIKLYYTRNTYTYKVQYLNLDTRDPIYPETIVNNAPFDSVKEETAPEITGYDLYGSETQSLKISTDESLNLITFLYTPKTFTVNYIPVCRVPGIEGGYVLNSAEYGKTINGTTALANSGFQFAGWYSDPDCNNKVSGNKFYKPEVNSNTGVYDYTFYALFEPITLTIKQEGMRNNDECAIYEIVNSANEVICTVAICGNSSVTLEQIPAGAYTIREITSDWTWTYDTTNRIEFIVKANENNMVTFTHTPKTVDWLHSECHNQTK